MKRLLLFSLLVTISLKIWSQSGTNSPYSQFGLGILNPNITSFNKGISGVGYGFRTGNQVNHQNPASYSSIDSLSFIFDAGVSLQVSNFTELGKSKTARNSNIDYVVAAFRAYRHLGVSFGMLPVTNVGYNYKTVSDVNHISTTYDKPVSYTNRYFGSGGLKQVYLGLGWEPLRGLSLGVNAGYLWGNILRNVENSYSDRHINTVMKHYNLEIRSFDVDLGLQYSQRLNTKNSVTLGLFYSLGHPLNGKQECSIISNNFLTGVMDSTCYFINNVYSLPQTFGAGLMYNHNNKLTIGADYELQRWKGIEMPELLRIGGEHKFLLVNNNFLNSNRFSIGGDYCRGERYRGIWNRIHYRIGASYVTPYVNIAGKEGPRYISASLGFGIPIINTLNNRSWLNISADWINRYAHDMINENIFRINIGFTFNERWFAKFKVK